MVEIILLAISDAILSIILFIIWNSVAIKKKETGPQVEYGMLTYRSQKTDGSFEGTIFIQKSANESWSDRISIELHTIERERDAKSQVIGTSFSRL